MQIYTFFPNTHKIFMNNVFSPPIGSLRVGNNTEACFNNILKALNTSIPVVGLLLLGELLIRDKAGVKFFFHRSSSAPKTTPAIYVSEPTFFCQFFYKCRHLDRQLHIRSIYRLGNIIIIFHSQIVNKKKDVLLYAKLKKSRLQSSQLQTSLY